MPAPLLSTIDRLAELILGGGPRPILLLTDFDGTLCEFRNDPAAVELSAPRRLALSSLAARPEVTVGIVSGRRAMDVRQRTALEGPVYYAGLHGLEIDGPHGRFEVPAFGARRAELQQVGQALGRAIAPLAGALLENKDLSVALHVRAAAPPDRQRAERLFWTLAGPLLETGAARLQRGDCVFELLPDISWTKGDAVRWIEEDDARRRGCTALPVYFGDDQTDEHAFEAIGDRGVTVVVGPRPSGAQHRLPDPAAVEQLLQRLATRLDSP